VQKCLILPRTRLLLLWPCLIPYERRLKFKLDTETEFVWTLRRRRKSLGYKIYPGRIDPSNTQRLGQDGIILEPIITNYFQIKTIFRSRCNRIFDARSRSNLQGSRGSLKSEPKLKNVSGSLFPDPKRTFELNKDDHGSLITWKKQKLQLYAEWKKWTFSKPYNNCSEMKKIIMHNTE